MTAPRSAFADLPEPGAPLSALAEKYLAVLVMTLAGRLNRGAANFYMRQFNITVNDYRIMLALGLAQGLNVGEVATAAIVDKAAASRSLRLLKKRGLVDMEQTNSRGRAAIVRLTAAGKAFERELKKTARMREARFLAALDTDERTQTALLVRKLIDGVAHMNQD